MPELTFRPQMTVVDPDTKIGTVKHVHDYIRLINGRESIYVQDGHTYYGGGDPVDQSALPAWFWESYRACTPTARKAVGLELPGDSKVVSLPVESISQLSDLPDALRLQLLEQAAMLIQAPRMPVEAPKISDEGADTSTPSDALKSDPGASPFGDGGFEVWEKTVMPQATAEDLAVALDKHGWTCDDCGESVEMRLKGVHIAHHRRAAKARH